MEFDGEIKHHQCKEYADKPSDRTPEENEYNEQARKFARYYVYLEEGYDTVAPESHPERINAVRLAIQDLTESEFEGLFGDLYRQMRSYHDYDTERPIPEPPLASENILYRQHVYLGIDPLETDIAAGAREMASAYGLDLAKDTLTEQAVDALSSADIDDWRAFADDLVALAEDEGITLEEGTYVDAVSSLYATYLDDSGEQYVSEPEHDPFERDPDALIELPPIDPRSIDEFREFLDHHLKCQIRDCFVRMGVEPPEDFRVLGNGRLEAIAAYKLLEIYPSYHDPEAQTHTSSIL
ncbi:hypothetical protein [Haloterrigena salifodinae]|uniref:hypothetical protein n=1 Tax=Haloterrigena salifodinae TaxID=2675099 RepID=UPI002013B373|nr:hypothetical protein [Haloterrigena salifodinae]